MKIGQLAERSGVTAKTIRYYEERGLLPEPERTLSNYRDYDAEVVERLRFIRDCQAAGLSLGEVGGILRMKDAGESTCEHTRSLVERHIEDIDAQIAALQAARTSLRTLAERAQQADPADCCDPHRCQVISLG